MLSPVTEPIPHDLQERGYHTLETLEGLDVAQQLNLACRTRPVIHEQLAKAAVRLAGVLKRAVGRQ